MFVFAESVKRDTWLVNWVVMVPFFSVQVDLRVGRWRSLNGDVDPRVVVRTQPHIIVLTFS
jgi:hypothetical protein